MPYLPPPRPPARPTCGQVGTHGERRDQADVARMPLHNGAHRSRIVQICVQKGNAITMCSGMLDVVCKAFIPCFRPRLQGFTCVVKKTHNLHSHLLQWHHLFYSRSNNSLLGVVSGERSVYPIDWRRCAKVGVAVAMPWCAISSLKR